MPNHVTNQITIIGTPEQVEAVREFVKSDKSIFDFQKIVPRPTSLNITAGTHLSDDEKIAEKINIEMYGHKNWYDWSIGNWGTKWNAYNHSEIGTDTICFQTAWSHPYEIIEALCFKFPEVKFSIEYADEDTGYNVGAYIQQGADVLEENTPEGGSKEAYRMAIRINGVTLIAYLTDYPEDCEEGLEDGNTYYETLMELAIQEEIIDEEFSVIQIQWAIANCTVEENFSYVKVLNKLLDSKTDTKEK